MPMCRQFSFGVETLAEGELASHAHIVAKTSAIVGWSENSPEGVYGDITSGTTIMKKEPKTYESGGNQPHNNLPPLYGVYRFRRTT